MPPPTLLMVQVESDFGLRLFDIYDTTGLMVARDLTVNQCASLAAQRGAELKPASVGLVPKTK